MSGAFTAYYDGTQGRPPRRTLLEALNRFEAPGSAVDLGCGDGRDTVELLRRGWRVLAIDREAEAIARLRARVSAPLLETRVGRFEREDWPRGDLVNASFALPLCPPEEFPKLWRKIEASLNPGGRFAGQLYGERDGWAGRPGLTHLTREAVEKLLSNWKIELFEEEESDTTTPRGCTWYVLARIMRPGSTNKRKNVRFSG